MIKTFKAAVLFQQNKPLKIIDLKIPKKLKIGQVLVKIITSAICGAQIGEIKGIKGKDKWLPHCMGHEGYGKVISKSSSIKKFKIGDYVVMHWRKGSGINSIAHSYESKFGKINAGQVTTFQEYAVISENRLTKIKKFKDKNISLAPLLGCAIPTAWGILNKESSISKSDNILIFGAGGLGTTLSIIAKISGCKNICVVDKFQNKKNILSKFKVKFINIKKFHLIKKIKFSRVIDTTGNVKIINLAFDNVDKNGHLILVGLPKRNSVLKINDPIKLFNSPDANIKIFISDGGLFSPDEDMHKIFNIINKNLKEFSELITHQFKIEKVNEAIKLINNGKAIRVGLKFVQ